METLTIITTFAKGEEKYIPKFMETIRFFMSPNIILVTNEPDIPIDLAVKTITILPSTDNSKGYMRNLALGSVSEGYIMFMNLSDRLSNPKDFFKNLIITMAESPDIISIPRTSKVDTFTPKVHLGVKSFEEMLDPESLIRLPIFHTRVVQRYPAYDDLGIVYTLLLYEKSNKILALAPSLGSDVVYIKDECTDSNRITSYYEVLARWKAASRTIGKQAYPSASSTPANILEFSRLQELCRCLQ